jgi:hypothetical protein
MNIALYLFIILMAINILILAPIIYFSITIKYDKYFKEMATLKWLPNLPGSGWIMRSIAYCGLILRKRVKKHKYYNDEMALFDFKSNSSLADRIIAFLFIYSFIIAVIPISILMIMNTILPNYFPLPK